MTPSDIQTRSYAGKYVEVSGVQKKKVNYGFPV